MACRGNISLALGDVVARLGALLMTVVAGEDERLRETIACAVRRARPHRGPDPMNHWGARYDPASRRRAE